MGNKLALALVAVGAALVLGFIAGYGVAHCIGSRERNGPQRESYLRQPDEDQASQFKKKYRSGRVAAAGKRISAGTIIEPNMLLREEDKDHNIIGLGIEMPEAAVTQENVMAADEDRLIGQTINRTVERGEPLLVSYFRQPIENLCDKLSPYERAMTLHLEAILSGSDKITPGSHVDIIAISPSPGSGAAAGRTSGVAAVRARLLLSNVTVLALDDRARGGDYAASDTGMQRSRSYSSVTLAVTPDEANLLAFAQQYGALMIALRSPVSRPGSESKLEVNENNWLEIAAELETQRRKRLMDVPPITPSPVNP